MSINVNTSPNAAMKCVQSYQEQIQIHPAWHSGIPENESAKLLIGKSPFTYLLRSGEKECPYFISFVREDGSIKHQFFALEFDRRGWLYKNGGTTPQIISKDLDQLIPMMMHCDSFACTPLKKCLK